MASLNQNDHGNDEVELNLDTERPEMNENGSVTNLASLKFIQNKKVVHLIPVVHLLQNVLQIARKVERPFEVLLEGRKVERKQSGRDENLQSF